jgi:hypothetical protein
MVTPHRVNAAGAKILWCRSIAPPELLAEVG